MKVVLNFICPDEFDHKLPSINFSLHLQALRLMYKLIVSISKTMDQKMNQRIELIRRIGEKIKQIPIGIKATKEELDQTLTRLGKYDTRIFGSYRPNAGSEQHQNPPTSGPNGLSIFGLDIDRQRSFHQPKRDRTALANISSNNKESRALAQPDKNVAQNKEVKMGQTVPVASNVFSNLNQQPNSNKQPSLERSASLDPQDNTEKKAELIKMERQVETVEQEIKTDLPILFQQKQAEQKRKELSVFGNLKPQGNLFASKIQGGLFASKQQESLLQTKPQRNIFASKPEGGLFGPKPQKSMLFNLPVKSSSENSSPSLFGKPQITPLFDSDLPAQKNQSIVGQNTETEKNQPSLFGNTKTNIPLFSTGSTGLPAPNLTNPEPTKSLKSFPLPLTQASKQIKPTFGGFLGGNTNSSQPLFKLQPVPEKPESKVQEKPKLKNIFCNQTQPTKNILQQNQQLKQRLNIFGRPHHSMHKDSFTAPVPQFTTQPLSASEAEKPPALFSQQITFEQPLSILLKNNPTKTVNQPSTATISNKNEEGPHKQPEGNNKIEKPSSITAIGPGGTKIEMKPFYPNDNNSKKHNIFDVRNNERKASPFTETQPARPNMFENGISSFANPFKAYANNPPNTGIFGGIGGSQPNLSSNIFGGSGGTQASKILFNNPVTSTQPKKQSEDDEQGEDDEILEAKDEADPSLSTGNFKYIQTQVFFKESAAKFREGEDNTKETIQNVVVSIEKFEDSASKYIYVRMANKCIALNGQLIPGITEIRVLNNNPRNVAVKKILRVMENAEKPQLVGIKIQFKEESVGERFKQEMEQALAKTS